MSSPASFPTFTPVLWKSGINPKDPNSFQTFMKQLADWGNNIQNQVQSLLLNPVTPQTINPLSHEFGSVSTNQTFNASGATWVTLSLTMTSTLSLTINNLTIGTPVCIKLTSTVSHPFTLFANTPAPVAYTVTAVSSGGAINMSTGFTPAAQSYVFIGNSTATTPELILSLV
jgi:hypothetical protein